MRRQIQEVPLLRDQVYQVLVEMLVSGQLTPGDRVTERALADQLGISTTPVKEALRRLDNEGFVHTLPRRGIRVSENALTSMEQVIVVRANLEGLAARLAADRLGTLELEGNGAYEDLLATLELMRDAVRRPVPETIEINTRFHQAIQTLSGNRLIEQFLGTIHGVDIAVRRRALTDPEELQRGNVEHIAIGDAVLACDADLAESLMREHVTRSATHTIRQPVADTSSTMS